MDRQTVYLETSIISYLTARPSRDLRAAAWQEATVQWWTAERGRYDLFTLELVVMEASAGDPQAAASRLGVLSSIAGLPVDDEVRVLAAKLVEGGGVPPEAELDALHIAVACVHEIDYLLTWNCRHINNAAVKPVVRSICMMAGYPCSEICTPLELLTEEQNDA
ncbi:MAG TPA: type II toxin-antitoxin system VapC family toxin [Sedimentisphaerales bacterium]|nr:type II toxin-antitoxin system VapC family toxin [Sedimentisphaerales bacterium]